MAEPILRAGEWWHEQPDGSWLRWNNQSNGWESQAGSPPPESPPGSAPAYGGAPGYYQAQAPGQGPQGYGGGPGYAGGPQGATPPGRVLTILGFVFGAIAILFVPILFGPAAIICAGIATSKGDPLAKWALGVAIGGTILGFALGYIAYESLT